MDKKPRKFLLPLLVSVGVLSLGVVVLFLAKKMGLLGRIFVCMSKKRLETAKRRAVKAVILEDVDFSSTNLTDQGLFDAPLVDFMSIICATDDFSDINKIGSGGFGSVYKVISSAIVPKIPTNLRTSYFIDSVYCNYLSLNTHVPCAG